MRMIACALSACIACSLSSTSLTAHAVDIRGETDVPIIMYHSLTERSNDKWTLPPSEFEKDLAYLKENGYNAVFVSELVAFVEGSADLPENPIVITFDDCYYNNYEYALPLLEQYDMKMTLSVIGSYTEEFSEVEDQNVDYAHLSWEALAEMQASRRVELANHTWGLHTHEKGRDGCCRIAGEELEAYRRVFTEDVGRLQKRLLDTCGAVPICFTYPFGSKCPEALEILRDMGFKASLSCYEGQNTIRRRDPDCLYDLRRNNRSPGKSVECILREIASG